MHLRDIFEAVDGITPSAASASPEADGRRAADEALVIVLTADGFAGPRWEKFNRDLMDYGWRVLNGWIATGKIFHECSRQGRGLEVRAGALRALSDPDVRYELAADTIIKTVPKFRDRIADGRWQASRSRLTTYFIGAAILEFPNVYRRWESSLKVSSAEELWGLAGDFEGVSTERGPAATAADRDEVRRIVGTLPGDLQQIVELKADGYTTAEVAGLLGVTEKAVERRLYRLRRLLRLRRQSVANGRFGRQHSQGDLRWGVSDVRAEVSMATDQRASDAHVSC
ncbi:sigma factor-like helix-turn-helix DNA-binding protein [Streptomyces sp. NPDC006700]|uniref:sigma factor-like helix-turn-helix DNA-binding protein n=1 Tax=Streptomyces sp. NPDC006700 TaxID=3154479 RepID=UPI0033F3C8B4